MIRDKDFNWQFWRGCYCALDRELNYLIEFKPTVKDGQFALMIILNETKSDNSTITKERIFGKTYLLDSVKIDLQKDWFKWSEKFYEDYFSFKEKGCKG
jgi:hypothetical protein